MALLSLAECMSLIGVKQPLSGEDTARYTALLAGATAAVKNYCKWEIEAVADYVDYYSGNGHPDLPLRKPYVTAVASVKLDTTGAWGQRAGSFAAATALPQGTDWALRIDDNNGTRARSGILVRLSATSPYRFPSDLFFSRGRSGLSYSLPAAWPSGDGNLKVTYSYGFATIPDDIKLATATIVGMVRNTVKTGGFVTGESTGAYNYNQQLGKDPLLGEARQMLSRYRDTIL